MIVMPGLPNPVRQGTAHVCRLCFLPMDEEENDPSFFQGDFRSRRQEHLHFFFACRGEKWQWQCKRSGFLGKGFYCMDKLKIFPIFIIILICYMNIKGKCILQYVHFINSYFKFYCKCSSVKIKIWFQPYFSISASLNQWKRLRNCLLLQ